MPVNGSRPRQEEWTISLLITGVFAALVIFISCYYHTLPIFLEIDDYYGKAERFLAQGELDDIYHPPLYIIGTAYLSYLTGDFFAAGKLLSLVSFIGMVFLTYGAGRLLFSPRAALLAQLFTALNGFIIFHAPAVLTDTLFSFLALMPIFIAAYMWRKSRPELFPTVLMALTAGLAYLTRYSVLFFIPALYLAYLPRRKADLARNLVLAVVFTVGMALVIAPLWLYHASHYGQALNTQHYSNIAWAIYQYDQSKPALSFSQLLMMIVQNPWPAVRNTAGNLFHGISSLILFFGGNPLWGLLMFVALFRWSRKHVVILLAVYLYFMGHVFLFKQVHRYFIVLIPFINLLAADWMMEEGGADKYRRWLSAPKLYFILLSVSVLMVWTIYIPRFINEHHYEARRLADNYRFPPGSQMATNIVDLVEIDKVPNLNLIFYYPASYKKRGEFYCELEKFLKDKNADYLLVDERHWEPSFKNYLLYADQLPPYLKIAAEEDKPKRARLFKVVR